MSTLVGRRADQARLEAALERARGGDGSIVLLSGEAGVGKSRLAAAFAAECSDALVLTGSATRSGTEPYGPLVSALRSYLRSRRKGLERCGPLRPHLGLILPELGPAPDTTDRTTLFEAVRCAFAELAAERPLLLLLDDLQWSDEATLELLAALAAPLTELPIVLVATYRSDGLPRDHGVRRLRHELRRAGLLDEIALGPLDVAETAELLAAMLGSDPSPSLVGAVHDRTQGNPFFIEELAGALAVSGSLVAGTLGLELARHGEVPVPDTVRDAVLIRSAELSDTARAAAETAAVAGETFDLEIVGRLAGEDGLVELIEGGLLHEDGAGGAAFRHALTREALYADVPWLRRRTLHTQLAAALEAAGASSRAVATHWLSAREESHARAALLRAAAESEAVHAYRDAADAARRALELWRDDEDVEARPDALHRYARCAELAGYLGEAARAWRELADLLTVAEDHRALGEARRHLAGVQEMQGNRDAGFASHRAAAEAFAAAGCAGEAAVEHLVMANQRRLSAKHREAAELARTAREQADAAGRLDLRVRALGLEGMASAKGGDFEGGLEMVRGALAVALEHDLTPAAAELYQRLSVTLYDSSDYRRAEEALQTAIGLCEATGDAPTEAACVTCLAYVLRERGEWSRACEICTRLMAEGTMVWVAAGLLGAIQCNQGKLSSARRHLTSSLSGATQARHYNMTIDTTASLARVDAAEGDDAGAAERCRAVLRLWEQSDDHHYAIGALRWGASFFATRRELADAHVCADALTRIAADTGYPDALAALAHAIGETALADRDTATAAEQLMRAVELHRDLDLPFERAQIEVRAGVALHAAGEREPALEQLSSAYRAARKLGAQPLAAEAAREVAAMGESVAGRLGRRAAGDATAAGLSRRELEVVRLVAVGRTNPEIATELFLSPRTVDMHVRNILRKLDCRSRVEAANRAGELGFLVFNAREGGQVRVMAFARALAKGDPEAGRFVRQTLREKWADIKAKTS